MKVKNLFYLAAIIFLIFSACRGKDENRQQGLGLEIRLTKDNSSVELYNIPLQVTDQLRSDPLEDEQWADFFAVYNETEDPEMRDFQPAIAGSYTLQDSIVIFKPDAGFRKGQAYFARCYARETLLEPDNLLDEKDLSPTNDFIEYKFRIK